jgi:putative heme iron utilization protein
MSSSSKKHAGPNPARDQHTIGEPSFAERARTLVYLGRIGSLSTPLREQPGFPFGSVIPYGLDDHGRPIFLIATNLQADRRASLLVTQPDTDGDPLGTSTVTLLGNVRLVPDREVAEARALYLDRYAQSESWVDFNGFSFYHMDIADVHYVGGFGMKGWISVSEYDRAKPDPLADAAADIMRHMNADHGGALILIARAFAGIEAQKATMTSVDRLGFRVRLKTSDGTLGARIAFLHEVTNPADTRKVLVEMTQRAREDLRESGVAQSLAQSFKFGF